MKLTYQQLTEAVSGAVRTWESPEGFHVCRFTEAQTDAYLIRREDFHRKALSASGIVLRFRTDSTSLRLSVLTRSGSSRNFFAVDVMAAGKYVDSLKNYEKRPVFGTNYVTMEAPQGAFEKTFSLADGEKEVAVYLPWSVECVITGLELEEGASFAPVKREKKLLAFGDSITQGYDALEPRNKYITALADWLGMEEINKAIGGEVFWPELAAMAEDFTPDLITVAYGTNDWSNLPREEAERNCKGFYQNLRKAYPNTPILALTPVWRAGTKGRVNRFGPFHEVEQMIREKTAGLPGVTVIRGWELIPQELSLYADLQLHPNDDGFRHYFESLLQTPEIRKLTVDS